MLRIGIIGNGFVGKATALFKCESIETMIYDIDPSLCVPLNVTISELCACDAIFICVPTPMNKDGSCYTKIVESCVQQIKDKSKTQSPFVVVRSTVPPNTCERLCVNHMPEFLTEKRWKSDFYNTKTWVIGTDDNLFKIWFVKLIEQAYKHDKIKSNSIAFTTTDESETIKYTRNSYLAVKVSFFNEVYQFCKAKNISYDTVLKCVLDDSRITSSHTKVPGHDGKCGYGGTCLPKDIRTFSFENEKAGVQPIILNASIQRNTTIDRKDHDWEQKVGRSVINFATREID